MILVAANNAIDGALEGGLRGAVVGGFAGVVLAAGVGFHRLLSRSTVDPLGKSDFVMVYSLTYRAIAIFSLLFAAAVWAMAGLVTAGLVAEKAALVALLPIGFGMTVGSLALAAEFFRRTVTVSEYGVSGRGWFRKSETVAWKRVVAIDYSLVLSAYKVRGRKGDVTVPVKMLGHTAFQKVCRDRLEKYLYENAFESAKKYASNY